MEEMRNTVSGGLSKGQENDDQVLLPLTRADVEAAYVALLNRSAESEAAINARLHPPKVTWTEFLRSFTNSPEFKRRIRPKTASNFFFSVPDAEKIILRHEQPIRRAVPDHFVNYLGVATRVSYVKVLSNMAGVVEAPPIPSNCHAEMVEWAAALRAVELSGRHFTVVELGAGWGCWMVNTAVAAKRLGKQITAVGIEGDQGHLDYLEEHCRTNGLLQSEYSARRLVAASKRGCALFPVVGNSSRSYGQEPKFFDTEAEANSFATTSGESFVSVPTESLDEILAPHDRVDLLHVDIQGGELDLVRSGLSVMQSKVGYVVIGTHSRGIDGALLDLLSSAGWSLEFEKPSTFVVNAKGAMVTTLDGTQGWRNPHTARF